jgi:tetratricopeptide (TPR) repeat protein
MSVGRIYLDQSVGLFRELDDRKGLARALWRRGQQKTHLGDAAGRTDLFEARNLAREAGDMWTMAMVYVTLTRAALNAGNLTEAKSHASEGLKVAEASRSAQGLGWVYYQLGRVAYSEGKLADARDYLEQSVLATRDAEEALLTGDALTLLGQVEGMLGDDARARELLGRSLSIYTRIGIPLRIAMASIAAANLAITRHSYAQGARLLGAAESIYPPLLTRLEHWDRAEYEAIRGTAQAALGKDSFDRAWVEGRAMMSEQAIEYALAMEARPDD